MLVISAEKFETLIFTASTIILLPIGLFLLTYTKTDTTLLEKLSQKEDIGKLYEQAITAEDKIKVLEEEKRVLSDTIKYEIKLNSLSEKKLNLELEASHILDNIEKIENELIPVK